MTSQTWLVFGFHSAWKEGPCRVLGRGGKWLSKHYSGSLCFARCILTGWGCENHSKNRYKSIGPLQCVGGGSAGRTGGSPTVQSGHWTVEWRLSHRADIMEDLHWTQLNLLLLSNFYKQIYQTGGQPSSDQLNCGGCSAVFPVTALKEYIEHKAGGECKGPVRPLGSPTITASDQITGEDSKPGPGMMSYYEFCFK